MADLKNLKGKGNKNRFGSVPVIETETDVLTAPEVAPTAEPIESAKTPTKRKARTKTGRTEPWGTNVKEGFKQRIRVVAALRNMSNAELLEVWLEAEEKRLNLNS